MPSSVRFGQHLDPTKNTIFTNYIFEYLISKLCFSSGQGVVQTEPNLAWSIPWVSRVKNHKNFCYSLTRKKVSFSYGLLRISRVTNFKIRYFSSGQGVVQIEPNSVCSIFAIACVGKKLVFHTEICDYFDRNNRKFPYENLTFFLENL